MERAPEQRRAPTLVAERARQGFGSAGSPGIKNMIFGGDGIFLASLAGPGRIWLQTLPISKLAHKLVEYMPKQQTEAVQGGGVGGIVGSILQGTK